MGCPICRHFLDMLPPGVLRDLVMRPKPYYFRLPDGRVYVTSEVETAIIDFDKKYAKNQVLKKTYKPEVRLYARTHSEFTAGSQRQD